MIQGHWPSISDKSLIHYLSYTYHIYKSEKACDNWYGKERECGDGLPEIEDRRCHSGQEEFLQIFGGSGGRRYNPDLHRGCILLMKEAASENLKGGSNL